MINNYIALDLETTGLNPAKDKIIEIGMARVENGEITETYNQLVYPGTCLSQRIIDITGINDGMLEGKPAIGDIIGDIVNFIGTGPILGHNVIFDYSFLKKAAVNANMAIPGAGIDTLKIARRLLPEVEHKRLEYLCEYFDIDPGNSHRALDDAISASTLYCKMYERRPDNWDFENTSELVYAVKKDSPITAAQKKYLIALLLHNNLELEADIETITKSEASRKIDEIISEYGKWT